MLFRSLSWFYLWVFRGTPVYVQLTFWGLLSVIYPTIDVGLPFLNPFITLPTALGLLSLVRSSSCRCCQGRRPNRGSRCRESDAVLGCRSGVVRVVGADVVSANDVDLVH